MSFEIPKITQAPTVAVLAEDASPMSDTDQNAAFITVDVKKFAGQQTFSVELLDRTSPAFFDELIRNMAAAKAKAENAYVNGLLISGATATELLRLLIQQLPSYLELSLAELLLFTQLQQDFQLHSLSL
jgi:hypothetical protein